MRLTTNHRIKILLLASTTSSYPQLTVSAFFNCSKSFYKNTNQRFISPFFVSNRKSSPPFQTKSRYNSRITISKNIMSFSNTSSSLLGSTFPEYIITHDTYNGVTVNLEKLDEFINNYNNDNSNNNSDDKINTIAQDNIIILHFEKILTKSLQIWEAEQKRGIWIHIPTHYSHLVPILTNPTTFGFDFQYAKKGLLVLTKWLPQDTESKLPHGPTHQIGVGAIILHPIHHSKILVVQEKSGPAAARKLWKMPTGVTDPSEDIHLAVQREVKEELGLDDCVFDRIICIRQAHGVGLLKNQSDMFFVCLVKLSTDVVDKIILHSKNNDNDNNNNDDDLNKIVKLQEEEIAMARWMDFDEFASQKLFKDAPLYQEIHQAIRNVIQQQKQHHGSNKTKNHEKHGDAGNSNNNTGRSEMNQNNVSNYDGFIGKTLPVGFRPESQTVYLSSKY